jgi:hypothetical protein
MKRNYSYEGYEVTVELDPIRDVAQGVTWLRPRGFVAVVRIRSAGASRDTVAPIRLPADSQRPYRSEAEALMAAYSAAQRLVDDTLVL